MERDRRKEVHQVVVALSNSEGQTAGGTRERQQRRALATTPQGAGRVGVTKKAENLEQKYPAVHSHELLPRKCTELCTELFPYIFAAKSHANVFAERYFFN